MTVVETIHSFIELIGHCWTMVMKLISPIYFLSKYLTRAENSCNEHFISLSCMVKGDWRSIKTNHEIKTFIVFLKNWSWLPICSLFSLIDKLSHQTKPSENTKPLFRNKCISVKCKSCRSSFTISTMFLLTELLEMGNKLDYL